MAPEPLPPGRRPAAGAPAAALQDLQRLLAAERDLLLRGDWAGVGALGARKEACLAALGALGPEAAPAARGLAAEVARNQALLLAAIEGFRDAGQRRALLRGARQGAGAYDARGARAPGPAAPPRVERRA